MRRFASWALPSVLFVMLCLSAANGCARRSAKPQSDKPAAVAAPRTVAVHAAVTAPNSAVPPAGTGQLTGAITPASAPVTQPTTQSSDPVARIRDEGMNRSQVMQTASYLMDVIGPRLTGSPNLRRANEWTRQQLESWGLVNAKLERWGEFGRGWSLRRFSAQIVEPQSILLIGCPKAWSPGLEEPITAEVVYVEGATDQELEKYRGRLKGKVVLSGDVREVQARFEPPAVRASDATLLELANAEGTARRPGEARGPTAAERRAAFASTPAGRALLSGAATRPATEPATTQAATTSSASAPAATAPTSGPSSRPSNRPWTRTLAFLAEEGAAVVVTPSFQGDGGTFFIGSAYLPLVERDRGQPATQPRPRAHPWDVDAPATPPQITVTAEDFNRLVRMIRQGETLKMAIDLQVQFHKEDLSAYNTVAEIPGTDLKDEIVMLGAHLDSWHAGTGATDNGAGVAATMEAVRILRALGLQPRRTVRIALWTGEEQDIYGSKGYVKEHFGYYPETDTNADTSDGNTTRPREGRRRRGGPTTRPAGDAPASQPARPLVRRDEYDKLSAYFNLDHGTGKIRGVYMEANEAVRPIFRQWLAPFADLGAQTLSAGRTGGTDHVSFDAVGLPAFQFIQDPIEYWSRTHHSNADVYDRLQAEDLKQASVILATFVYNAAMADEKLPRKPLKDAAEATTRPQEPTK